MKLYYKIFRTYPDMSIYLDNIEPLIAYGEELLNRLTASQSIEELHEAKCSILNDFRDIYIFDVSHAEFPEPIGRFDNKKEKNEFIKKKILLQDISLYLGTVYKKYHAFLYEQKGKLPEIQMKSLVIDYNEIYRKALEDYTAAIVNGFPHAVTASFVLPSLIEQGLSRSLQNRMLYKSICKLLDEEHLSEGFDAEERAYVSVFLSNPESIRFNANESHVMGKMYNLFVRKGTLKASLESKMILTGEGRKKGRTVIRTLGSLLNTNFAKEEIRAEYLEFMKDIFVRLKIRNCIMHGSGESFDYLNLGIVAIMFQLLWDIAEYEIFKD